jgi:hypothetical protein
MVIVDSTVWIDYLNDRSNPQMEWLDSRLAQEQIGLADLTLCEVLQGFRDHSRFEQAHASLTLLPVLNAGGTAVAVASAENYRILRAKGITVRKTIDCLIATFCIREGHALLHRDRDYDPFERHLGLRVVHP